MSILFGLSLLKLVAGGAGAGALGLVSHLTGAHKAAGDLVKRVPKKAWLWGAAVVALITFVWLHQHHANKLLKEAYEQGRTDEKAEAEKAAAHEDQRMADVLVPISEQARTHYEAETTRIRVSADALRLRGAGKAECRDPALSAGAGGHDQGGQQHGDAAVPKLPYPEWSALIAMPVSSAVGFAADHDALLAEVKTWHGWYNDTYAAWEKERLEAAKPRSQH